MLELDINGQSVWDEVSECFYDIQGCHLKLEHSLLSVSKWEAKYHKPFLNTTDKTAEQVLDYVSMMNIGDQPEDPLAYRLLTREQITLINEYIENPMTATTFSKEEDRAATGKPNKGKFITSEEIYYWMTTQNIPFECEKWHLNRLLTLIKICAIENKPDDKKPKRMTGEQLQARRAQMEAARRKYGVH